MGSHLLVSRVDIGFVAAGMGYAGLGVIGNDDLGNSAEELESPTVRRDPGEHVLVDGRFGVGVVTGSQHGDEDACHADFASPGVDYRHGLPCVIDEHFLSRLVYLAE